MHTRPAAERRGSRLPTLLAGILVLGLVGLLLAACGGSDNNSGSASPTATRPAGSQPSPSAQAATSCPPPGAATSLTGAGATFPFPLYSKWISEFDKQCNVQINYQSIGSGGGIKQITAKTVDFGASDGIMNDEQTAAAEAAGGPILHIPMTVGAVAVAFNLSGVQSGQLRLAPDVLADIYLKKITKWNDPRIAADNSGVNLPDTDIAVVHRSDGSGTSFIFTNYLSKVSQEWSDKVSYATSVQWPGDIGGEGNEGVANQVRQNPRRHRLCGASVRRPEQSALGCDSQQERHVRGAQPGRSHGRGHRHTAAR